MAGSGNRIVAGKEVELRYVMRDARGKLLDSTGDEAEAYVHGAGAIVPGLERALEGRAAGDRFEVTLAPADAYGPKKKSPGAQAVPRGTFPPDAELRPGMKFEAEAPDGKPVALYIVRVTEREVFVDTNHPYAGMPLSYAIEVVAVREPRTRR